MLMIYKGKEEPIDKIDFDIVDNGMEEEVENENENNMAVIEEDKDKDKDKDEDEDEDCETPEATKERKKEESRKIVKKNRGVSGEKAIDKTRKFQIGDDIMGVQSLRCIILLSMNHSIMYIIE